MRPRPVLFLVVAGLAGLLLAFKARRRAIRRQRVLHPQTVRDAEPTVSEPIQPEHLNVAQNAPF